MMSSGTPPSKRSVRRSDPRTLRRFVEELSWFLSTYDDLDFKALGDFAESAGRTPRRSKLLDAVRNSSNQNQESVTLLGTLPSLFINEELFPSNEDIAEFSKHALGVLIPRWHKKSKYELIGHVVCNANLLDKRRLRQLMEAVTSLQDDRSQTRRMVEDQRKSGLSWNEVIQHMLGEQSLGSASTQDGSGEPLAIEGEQDVSS